MYVGPRTTNMVFTSLTLYIQVVVQLLQSWKYNIISIYQVTYLSISLYKVDIYISRERRQMGRQPCCDKVGLKKGPWTIEEDKKLINFILTNGHCCWRALPKLSGFFSFYTSKRHRLKQLMIKSFIFSEHLFFHYPFFYRRKLYCFDIFFVLFLIFR